MTNSANSAEIVLRAVDQASATLAKVKAELTGLGVESKKTNSAWSTVGNSINGLKGTAGKAFTAIGAGAIGLTALVAKTGIGFDALKQQATIAFTTMLGSGEKAKVFLNDLQKFAAQTPFEFPDLIRASQRLLAMGFAAEKVIPTLTAVGDAAAGLGASAETIDRITLAMGQMQAKGKVSGEEIRQLAEAGIPAWEFIAAKIGKSIPEAMDMAEKGTIKASVAIDALTEGMEKKFGGMMEKQSHTFNGLLSTIKDTFTQISGQVLEPFFERATAGMQKLVDEISKPSFQRAVDKWTSSINQFSKVFETGFTKTVIAGFKWVIDNEGRIVGAIVAIGLAFAWTHPVAAAFMGAGGLIFLIGLFSTENDKAGIAVLNLKLKVLDFAKTAIDALGEVVKVMAQVSNPGSMLPGIKVMGIQLNPFKQAQTGANSLVDEATKKAKEFIDSLGGRGEITAALDKKVAEVQALNTAIETGKLFPRGIELATDRIKELGGELSPAAQLYIDGLESSTRAQIGAGAASTDLGGAVDKTKEKVLTLKDALEDSIISYAEALELKLTAAQAGALEATKFLADAQMKAEEHTFDLAKSIEKYNDLAKNGVEITKQYTNALAKESLEKLQAAAGALFANPTQEQAALQLKIAELQRNQAGFGVNNTLLGQQNEDRTRALDAQIAALEAQKKYSEQLKLDTTAIEASIAAKQKEKEQIASSFDRLNEPMNRQLEALQSQLALMNAEQGLRRAQLTAADKTLLTDAEQAKVTLELVGLIKDQSSATRASAAGTWDLVAGLREATQAAKDFKTITGGGDLSLSARGVPVFKPPAFNNSGGISGR